MDKQDISILSLIALFDKLYNAVSVKLVCSANRRRELWTKGGKLGVYVFWGFFLFIFFFTTYLTYDYDRSK